MHSVAYIFHYYTRTTYVTRNSTVAVIRALLAAAVAALFVRSYVCDRLQVTAVVARADTTPEDGRVDGIATCGRRK